jgi:hypothetical protein
MMEGNFHPYEGITKIRKLVISVSIGEEINQPGSIPAGDILPLSGISHVYSGYFPELPGSVLRKLDWEGFIKELTILPYFSADAVLSCASRQGSDVMMQLSAS